jgi:hypothetical protein
MKVVRESESLSCPSSKLKCGDCFTMPLRDNIWMKTNGGYVELSTGMQFDKMPVEVIPVPNAKVVW